jgi:hypothetical protein
LTTTETLPPSKVFAEINSVESEDGYDTDEEEAMCAFEHQVDLVALESGYVYDNEPIYTRALLRYMKIGLIILRETYACLLLIDGSNKWPSQERMEKFTTSGTGRRTVAPIVSAYIT